MKVPILDLQPACEELRPELDAVYRRVVDSGWVLLGRELESFELEYARSVGVKHCVGVANGLEALQLALLALGIGPGDEVIVPSHGYIATWLAVTHTGARPVPCEPDPHTYNLDPSHLPSLVTSRTRAILPIHLYGQTADMEAIRAGAARHNLLVIEDGAQSHGARCRRRARRSNKTGNTANPFESGSRGSATAGGELPNEPRALASLPAEAWAESGALGHAAGISFYPSKNLGALADAGAVTTNDDAVAEKVRALRNYGSKIRYHHEYLGLNSRLGELQAGFLRAKLPHLAGWNARRAARAAQYFQQLTGVGDLVLPFVPDWAQPVWHLFVVRTTRRDALQAHLTAQGIGTQIHYPVPPHLSPAYHEAGWKLGDFPLAEKLAGEVLSLPIGPHVSPEQIDYVCEKVREFYNH